MLSCRRLFQSSLTDVRREFWDECGHGLALLRTVRVGRCKESEKGKLEKGEGSHPGGRNCWRSWTGHGLRVEEGVDGTGLSDVSPDIRQGKHLAGHILRACNLSFTCRDRRSPLDSPAPLATALCLRTAARINALLVRSRSCLYCSPNDIRTGNKHLTGLINARECSLGEE